jgi:hypothetical protein
MDSALQNTFVVFNVCEGMLWVSIAVGILVVVYRKRQNADLMLVLAVLFAAFGVSDWVEITTGGWYKPWWMLTWKASNLVGFAVTFLLLRRRERRVHEDTA